MKSYREFSEEAEQLNELVPGLGLLGKGVKGGIGLGIKAVKALLGGDEEDKEQKVKDSKALKAVEKHT
jgi:hypothetical protein